MTADMKMIAIENLKSAYGKRKVLQGVSLDAERGECIGIVGPNGCGKSTLLSIMAGGLKPLSGSIFIMEKMRSKILLFFGR